MLRVLPCFLHSSETRPSELEDYLVEGGCLAQGLDTRGLGVGVDLGHGVVPLRLCAGVGVGGLECLELDDVAVAYGVAGEVGQQEEVAVAMVELKLGGEEVVGREVEVGHEEALKVALRLYGVAHGGDVLVGLGHEGQCGSPVAVVGHGVETVGERADIDARLGLVLLVEVVVVLLADVVVGDGEHHPVPVRAADGEHAVVEDEAGEDVGLDDVLGGERLLDLGAYLTLLGYAHEYAFALVVERVEADEPLELVVVGAGVAISHLGWRLAVVYQVVEVVYDHVGVEHAALAEGVGREAVVVVPRLHVGYDGVCADFLRDEVYALVVLYHLAHLVGGEPEEVVELGIEGDVPPDVEAAGEVVECHGADAGDEDAAEHALEDLEYAAVESRGVGEGGVDVGAVLAQHVVGEVVILVDDEVEGDAQHPRLDIDDVEHAGRGRRLGEALAHPLGIRLAIFPHEALDSPHDVLVERALKVVDAGRGPGEVETHDLISSLLGRGVLAYPEVAEELTEAVFHLAVVVGLEHAQEQALAEAARADEEEVARLPL